LLLRSCLLDILLNWRLIVILNFWTFVSINRKVVSVVSQRLSLRLLLLSFSKRSFSWRHWWISVIIIARSESILLRSWRIYWLFHWCGLCFLLSNWCRLLLSYWGLSWKILLSLKCWLWLSLCYLWWWKWLTCFGWLNSGCFISSVIVYTSWLFATAWSVVEASSKIDKAI